MAFSLFKRNKGNSKELIANQSSYETSYSEEIKKEYKDYELNNRVLDTYQSKIDSDRDVALASLNTINNVGGMVTGLINKGLDVWHTSMIVEQNIAAINSQTTVQLAEIAARYTTIQQALMSMYGERHGALQKHYDVLDKALASNDRDLIIASLKGVSSIVVSNPFEDFAKFMDAWENNSKDKPLELDF
ncbi:MAG: hypothetical protein J1F38_06215 [Muribaculaceae bacterium]|nr:hypothetical protein [Muribaculaceae bacterium]